MRLDDAVGGLLTSWGRIQVCVCVRIMYDNVVDDDDDEEEDDSCVKNWEGL